MTTTYAQRPTTELMAEIASSVGCVVEYVYASPKYNIPCAAHAVFLVNVMPIVTPVNRVITNFNTAGWAPVCRACMQELSIRGAITAYHEL